MRIIQSKYTALNSDMEPGTITSIFPRLRKDFDNIARLRECMEYLNVNNRLNKMKYGSFGRRIAHIPRPLFVWLSTKYPEILTNKMLLRQFLRNNPHLLLMPKE